MGPQHLGKASKASKAPQHPSKASKAPPSGKSNAAGGRNQPGADAHRKTKVKSGSSKPTVNKSENGDVSPSWKEAKAKTRRPPKGSAAQGALAPPARKKMDLSPKASTAMADNRGSGAKN